MDRNPSEEMLWTLRVDHNENCLSSCLVTEWTFYNALNDCRMKGI